MICLGLGANVGEREANIKRAVRDLAQGGAITVLAGAALYETTPVGFRAQGDFLNTVISVATALTPRQLLTACQETERRVGRRKTFRWGPRVIDIDLLCYDDCVIAAPDLVVPHPRLQERRFVLVPLCELAPQLVLPTADKPVCALLADCRDPGEVRLFKTVAWRREAGGNV